MRTDSSQSSAPGREPASPPPSSVPPQLSVQETVAARVTRETARDGQGTESLGGLISVLLVLTFVAIVAGCYLGVSGVERWDTTEDSPNELRTYAVAFSPLLAYLPFAYVLDARLRTIGWERRRVGWTWLLFAAMLLVAAFPILLCTSFFIAFNGLAY